MATRQARRRQQRTAQRKTGGSAPARSRSTTPWYLGPFGLGAAIVVIAVVLIYIVSQGGGTKKNTKFHSAPATTATLNPPENVSAAVISKVGDGGLTDPWTKGVGPGTTEWTTDGKPVFFYYGAEFCPHCAAIRWSLLDAMSRFGTFAPGSIYTMLSSSSDTNPNTRTFTFLHARYASKYVDFEPREVQDRNHNTLQNTTSAQSAVVSKYNSGLGFPFFDLARRAFANESGNFDESVFFNPSGHPYSWAQIGNDLKSATSPQSKSIVGFANWLTAGICKETKNQPSNVCSAKPIPHLEKQVGF